MAVAHGYVPAAGLRWLLPFYDPLLALFTRETKWRGMILESLELKPNDVLVDVGCGTGTLALMAKQGTPRAEVIGVDPDPDALARCAAKAARKNTTVSFLQGFGGDVARLVGTGRATKAVSSMVFHHMSPEVQVETIAAMRDALAPGGLIRIADFIEGQFEGPSEARLIGDLKAAGFENVRTIARFRIAFANAALIGGEKPKR